MSLYSVKRVLVSLKSKNRNWCLGRDMDHLANSTAELCQGGKNWYVGWQSFPMNTLKCLSIGTPKTINFPFVSN